jgi:large subunit ribosomal protein L4
MTPTLEILTLDGKKDGQLELPAHLFQATINPVLVAQAIRVYLHNQRQATAATKRRSDVAFTKAKLYRQKGTGRARHGARSAPIFVGGGVAHGPTGNQNYHLKLSKTMRRQALASVLTDKFNQQAILVVKGLDKVEAKTKNIIKLLSDLKLPADKPVLLLLDKPHQSLLRAARGLKNVHPTQAKRINTYEIVNHAHIIMTPDSITMLQEHYAPAPSSSEAKE